jgi:peroxiredoxin-like protein
MPAPADTHAYRVDLTWVGGKEGAATSPENLPTWRVASPPEFGGPPGVWTPEHLFVLALSSCFMTTFGVIAELSKLEVKSLWIGGVGTLERRADRKFHMSRVILRPRITIARAADRERALQLVEKAEANCLISNSVASEIEVLPEILITE